MQLYALQHLAVVIEEFRVERCKHRLIHLENLVGVVAECHVEVGIELTLLDDAIGVQVELPTHVAHGTHVAISEGGVTSVRRNAHRRHQHVATGCAIPLCLQRQLVVEEAEVGTDVVGRRGLPAQVGQTNVVRYHRTHVDIAVTLSVDTLIEIVLARLVTYPTPAGTDSQHR